MYPSREERNYKHIYRMPEYLVMFYPKAKLFSSMQLNIRNADYIGNIVVN